MVYSKKHQIILVAVILCAVAISIAVSDKEIITGEITQQSTRLPSSQSIGEEIRPEPEVHVSYYTTFSKDLKYAKYDGSLWTVSTVDVGNLIASNGTRANVGISNSITLDRDSNPVITYYDRDNNDVRFAKFVGAGNGGCNGNTEWVCEKVDDFSNAYVNVNKVMGINMLNYLNNLKYIIYIGTDNTLKVARGGQTNSGSGDCGENGNWQCLISIDNAIDQGVSTDRDRYASSGDENVIVTSYITYSPSGELRVAHLA